MAKMRIAKLKTDFWFAHDDPNQVVEYDDEYVEVVLEQDPKTLFQYKQYITAKQAKEQWQQQLYSGISVYNGLDDNGNIVLTHAVDPAGYTRPEVPPLTSKMFEDAIEHIQTHGWGQGANLSADGRVCLQGAFSKWHFQTPGELLVTGDMELMAIMSVRTMEILDLMGVDTSKFHSIPAWNDYKGRTKDEVIDALTLAAKKLRDEGR